MFADACEKAAKFTRPLIISTRMVSGTVVANCGAFVVINEDGWIMTAGHMFDSFVKFQNDQNKIKEVEELNKRNSTPGSPNNQIKPDPEWLTNHSFWWGWDGCRLTNVYVNRQIDIAVGKLEPFDKNWIKEYPVFRNPETMRPGTSLCRLGFPFANVNSEFDSKLNSFHITKGTLPLPLFPNDGIHTRNVMRGKSKDGNYDMLYIETSSPGLKGQSGGPIYDRDCKIYALQVQTAHFPLGFQPTVENEGKRVVENQFMNVGLGVHGRTIQKILGDRGIKFHLEGDESGFRIID
ncbi:MAG: serine protease [Candidatus Methanomethylophilaceae archaeon]|nr:serine protease [Candidatus Methanomethylophilaceae archaeon]MDD3378999.1 serine protease [Candidatus Methanomethylophilaceae archaeon]MDY0223865.1 serine protease [Candidatus Methanomethylophilaceae archaeon]